MLFITSIDREKKYDPKVSRSDVLYINFVLSIVSRISFMSLSHQKHMFTFCKFLHINNKVY